MNQIQFPSKAPAKFFYVMCLWLLSLAVMATAQQPTVLSDSFHANEAPVYSSRMFLIFGQSEEIAKTILNDKKFVKLDGKNVNKLLDMDNIDPAKMLEEQVRVANAYAVWRENDANLPFFSKDRRWMLQDAAKHRAYANYTRTINPDTLIPYLIKVHIALQGTGAFNLRWRNDKLFVFYGALGSSEGEKRDVYFVVFLEHALTDIEVSTSMTE